MSRRVLITGTTRGLGQFLAEHYLAAGDRVIGCGRSDASVRHERYTHQTVDVTDESAVKQLTATIRQHFGGLSFEEQVTVADPGPGVASTPGLSFLFLPRSQQKLRIRLDMLIQGLVVAHQGIG